MRKVLVVGAGAVGQVYGYHLHLGGAEVHFLVRPKYREELEKGMVLYQLNGDSKRRHPVRFREFRIHTDLATIAAVPFDDIILSISSTGLRGLDLGAMLRAAPRATLVSLQPGPDDQEWIKERWPAERLVRGVISLISYATPLPGEATDPPGIAYWFPPLSPAPMSGPAERLDPIVEALAQGGLPVKPVKDAGPFSAFGGSALMCVIVALEASGWTFRGLGRGRWLPLARRAMNEAFTIIERTSGYTRPIVTRILPPFVLRMILAGARFAVPLDFETYLKVHFTKVGDQTRLFMDTLVLEGRALGLPVEALSELAAARGQPARPDGHADRRHPSTS